MTEAGLRAVLPLLVTAATSIVLLSSIAFRRNHKRSAAIAITGIGLALAIALARIGADASATAFTDLLLVDSAARLGWVLVLGSTLAVLALCHGYFESYPGNRDEIYLLVTIGTLGAMTLSCAQHIAALLLGLELLSLPMIAAVAYATAQRRAIESGAKYLVLSAGATGALLFGLALIYAHTGALDLATVGFAIDRASLDSPLLAVGGAMVLGGIAFKLSLVPFHQWTPDVYEGAPIPITGYLATAGKVGAFVVALRLFHLDAAHGPSLALACISGLALASMLVGSLLALKQTNLKRLFAYSSVAHFGYLAMLVAAPGQAALHAAGVYLTAYVVTSLGVFGVLVLASSPMAARDEEMLDDYRGLFWHRPYLAAILIVMLLSLAGIPLTAGFVGKLVVIEVGVAAAQWWLVGGVVFASLVSAFYYLRVMSALTAPRPGAEADVRGASWAGSAGGLVIVLAIVVALWLGVYPQPLLDFGGHITLLH